MGSREQKRTGSLGGRSGRRVEQMRGRKSREESPVRGQLPGGGCTLWVAEDDRDKSRGEIDYP